MIYLPSGKLCDGDGDLVDPLLSCVIGPDNRPPSPDPAWLTADVLGLVRSIQAERAFHCLPILADALMEAGCDHAGILGHCRTEEAHSPGWGSRACC